MKNAFKLGPVLQREYDTLAIMLTLYCKDHHQGIAPCHECAAFLQYATMRLDRCPYGEDKPTCSRCPVHCYKPSEKALAKTVMGYAGPRMIFRHPIIAIRHLIHECCRPDAGKPPNDKSNRHQRQLVVGKPRSPKG